MNIRKKPNRGFTLIEIIVTLTILLVVAASLTKAIGSAGEASRVKRAQIAGETVFKTAIFSYCTMKAQSQDAAGYLNALTLLSSATASQPPPPGSPSGSPTLTGVLGALVSSGCAAYNAVIDPWGNPYQVSIGSPSSGNADVTIKPGSPNQNKVNVKFNTSDLFNL
jgi:prepilin-type N-terminal cleavage/methylation domain-containing protein